MYLKIPACLIFMLSVLQFSSQQHIFDATCEFTAVGVNKTHILKFASQVIHISSRMYDAYINFCKPLRNSAPGACDGNSKLCVINKRNHRRTLQAPVTSFQGATVFNNETKAENIVLRTNDLGDCDGEKYQLNIAIDSKVISNQINYGDACALDLTIVHPNVEIRDCGFAYQGIIIDMTPLRQYSEQNITSNTSSSITKLALCRNAPSCGGSAICNVSPQGNVVAVAETQHAVYDERSNLVTIRGRKGKLKSEVIVKCNWTASFDNPQKQLANNKFTIDSKLGCVKIPLNCQVVDIENYVYNLAALYKKSGWQVKNTTTPMLINICGTLNNPARSPCANIHAQVCLQQTGARGGHLSYGALHTGLHFDGGDLILTYTHGSTCAVKPNEYLSTRVTLRCAPTENQPLLTSIVDCTANVLWKTPEACAKGISEASSFGFPRVMQDFHRTKDLPCTVYHNGQMFSIGGLKTTDATGMVFDSRIKPNLKYYVNICRPIALSRGNFYCGVTGACIDDGDEPNLKKRFKWFGVLAAPKIENDELVIRYNGGYCENSTQREILITFNCSKRQEPLKLVNEQPCHTDFLWNTPLACKKKTERSLESVNCQIVTQNAQVMNIDKIQPRKFQAVYSNLTYDVDLCSNVIVLSSNSTEKAPALGNGLMTATRSLFSDDCSYSMLYTLPKINNATCVESHRLQSIKVNLLCNDIKNDADHIGNYNVDGCEMFVSLKSSYMCNLLVCKPKPAQIVQQSKDVYSVLNTITSELEPKALTRGENSCIIPNGDRTLPVSILKANITLERNVYTIGSETGNKSFETYSCKGFVCKNNQTLATLDLCPSVNIQDEAKVELTLIGPKCNNGFYEVKITLQCKNLLGTSKSAIAREDTCFTHIEIANDDVCVLFEPTASTSEKLQGINNGYIIGIVACLVIILASSVIIWKYRLLRAKFICFGEKTDAPCRRELLYVRDACA